MPLLVMVHGKISLGQIVVGYLGLLSIGEESHKGNELTRTAWPLLKALPINFIGNAVTIEFPQIDARRSPPLRRDPALDASP